MAQAGTWRAAGADFFTQVALQRVTWARRVFFSGNNPDLDPGSEPEDVHAAGGLFSFKPTGGQLEVASSSLNDSAAGTGMRTGRFDFLTDLYEEVSETLTMNGTTPVLTTRTDLLRINGALGMSAGSLGRNDGTITIRDAGGGTARATIPIFTEGAVTQGQTFIDQMLYTVPAGHTMLVYSVDLTVNRATADRFVTGRVYARSSAGVIRTSKAFGVSSGAAFLLQGRLPVPIPEKTDWWVRLINTSGVNTDVSCSGEAILVNNAKAPA